MNNEDCWNKIWCRRAYSNTGVSEQLHKSLIVGFPMQVMITGDQALTACHVAAQVHIVTRPVLILTVQTGDGELGDFDWVSPDEKLRIPYKYKHFALLLILYTFKVQEFIWEFHPCYQNIYEEGVNDDFN